MSSSASSAVRENASGVLYDLLTAAAGAGLLEKAVFSKCRDRAVVRIVLTLRLVRNNAFCKPRPSGRQRLPQSPEKPSLFRRGRKICRWIRHPDRPATV